MQHQEPIKKLEKQPAVYYYQMPYSRTAHEIPMEIQPTHHEVVAKLNEVIDRLNELS